MKGWFWISENPSAAAFAVGPGYRSSPPNVPWLRDSGLQGSEVTKNGLLAGLFHDQPVKKEHLSKAEVTHYFRRS